MISSTKYLTYDAAYYLTMKVKEIVDAIDSSQIDLTEYITEEELNTILTEALDGLKGEQGEPGKDGADGEDGISIKNIFIDNDVLYITMTDGVTYNLGNIRGADGTVSFDELTDEQKESLKGDTGEAGATFIPSIDEDCTLSWINTGGLANPDPVSIKGDKGDAFTYEDFTEEQLESLKGADGTMVFEDLTAAQKESLKGDKGDQGEKGEDGDPGVYYGTEQPTDGTLIWINPNGNASPDYLTTDDVDTIIEEKVNEKISSVDASDISIDLSGYSTTDHTHLVEDITDFPTLGSASKAEVGTTITSGSDLLPTSNTVYLAINSLRNEVLAKIPTLDGYATETYVANAISTANSLDLEGYATEEYVNNAIAAVETGDIDLLGYYTKTEVDTAIDTKIAEQTHLTKDEVNTLIDAKLGVIEDGTY